METVMHTSTSGHCDDARPSALSFVGHYLAGLLLASVVIFSSTVFAGVWSFTDETASWGIPLLVVLAVFVAISAWLIRGRNAVLSAGMWTGWALGIVISD